MGQILFLIIAITFAIQIFREPGVKKLPWFFAGILFFPHTIELLQTPSLPFPRFMVLSLAIATIVEKGNCTIQFKSFPLKKSLLFLLIMFLCIGIFDERLSLFLKIYRPLYHFLESFSVVFLTYCHIKSLRDIRYIYNIIIIYFSFFAIYGISNFFTRQSEYFNFIVDVYGGRNFAESNMERGVDRFRITSFSWHAIVYGFLVYMALLMQAFMFATKRIIKYHKNLYLVIFLLLLVNLFLVNSRTPLFSFVIGAGIFLVFGASLKQKIKAASIGLILICSVFAYVPSATKLVNESIKTFSSKGSKLEGSSLEMREIQLAASVAVFNQNPLFGNGFAYIVEDLGYSSRKNERESSSDFAGFESYIYKLLIEQGLLGIIGNIVLFFSWIVWLLNVYKEVTWEGQKMVVLCISMILAYLFFITGTGDLNTFLVFMSIMGINTKFIIISKRLKLISSIRLNLINGGLYKI